VSEVDDQVARVAKLIAQQPATAADRDSVVDMLQRLCGAAARSLSASGVGLSLLADDGVRGVATASDPASERIEELQYLIGEGPCVDAFATRRPVLVPDLADSASRRWPAYTPAVHDCGIRALFAFPLQIGAARLGVLDVFRSRPGRLSNDELGQAFTFAEVAVTTLLDRQETASNGAATDGLDKAIERTAELFQAQGMVMVQLGVGLTEALSRIRAHAYAEDRSLTEVARSIVARRLWFDRERP
jgi:hypothetical protein